MQYHDYLHTNSRNPCFDTILPCTGSAAAMGIRNADEEDGRMSAAGIVLFYLIRQEPWAKLARSLQVSRHRVLSACNTGQRTTATC